MALDLHLDTLYVASAPTLFLDFKDRSQSWNSSNELVYRHIEAKLLPGLCDSAYSEPGDI